MHLPDRLTAKKIREKTVQLGIADFGVVAAGDSESQSTFTDWIDRGCSASMDWLVKNAPARQHPRFVFPAVQTILVGAVSLTELPTRQELASQAFIESGDNFQNSDGIGLIIPYAGRTDYHLIVRSKLQQLGNFLQSYHLDLTFRVTVDTAPISEKEWAVRAGLGTIGNHSLLIHPQMGTACFLGTLLLSKQWESIASPVPQPTTQSGQFVKSCRQCNRCRENCPTGALIEGKLLDARRCLNYWTIENRDKQTPTSITKSLDNRLIGCDLCQRVCPCNESVDLGKPIGLPLEQVKRMTPEEFNRLFDQTPLQRVGLERLKRNIGNLMVGRYEQQPE